MLPAASTVVEAVLIVGWSFPGAAVRNKVKRQLIEEKTVSIRDCVLEARNHERKQGYIVNGRNVMKESVLLWRGEARQQRLWMPSLAVDHPAPGQSDLSTKAGKINTDGLCSE